MHKPTLTRKLSLVVLRRLRLMTLTVSRDLMMKTNKCRMEVEISTNYSVEEVRRAHLREKQVRMKIKISSPR